MEAVEARKHKSVLIITEQTNLAKLTLKCTAPMIKLEAMGAIIWIYKKVLILLNSANAPRADDTEEEIMF